ILGDIHAALRVLRDLVEMRNAYSALGAEFPVEDTSLNEEQAALLWRTQTYGNAAVMFKEVLAAYETRSPADSHDVLRARSNYAEALHKAGGPDNLKRASELLRSVHEVTLKKYGPRHRWSIIVESNLSAVLLELGDTAAGIALTEHALDNARAGLGED